MGRCSGICYRELRPERYYYPHSIESILIVTSDYRKVKKNREKIDPGRSLKHRYRYVLPGYDKGSNDNTDTTTYIDQTSKEKSKSP